MGYMRGFSSNVVCPFISKHIIYSSKGPGPGPTGMRAGSALILQNIELQGGRVNFTSEIPSQQLPQAQERRFYLS